MTDTYSFRTAVGGFHKGDVTDYIAKTARAYEAQVAELEKRLESLQAENDRLRQQLLEQSDAVLPEEEPVTPAEPEQVPGIQAQELAAYRRAEAAERMAARRVRKLYAEMQDVCGRSTRQSGTSETAVREAMETIDKQLEVIRISVAALHDGLRTSSEELQAMSQMVPDPAEGLED